MPGVELQIMLSLLTSLSCTGMPGADAHATFTDSRSSNDCMTNSITDGITLLQASTAFPLAAASLGSFWSTLS